MPDVLRYSPMRAAILYLCRMNEDRSRDRIIGYHTLACPRRAVLADVEPVLIS